MIFPQSGYIFFFKLIKWRDNEKTYTFDCSPCIYLQPVLHFAERYVMITHGEGKDPFWPVVQKGGEDAARAIGADFEYIYNPSADMADMASSIQAAAATQPDGIVVSLPDPDALGPAIKAAVAAGVPVITMNSGLESSASLGALMHVGQPEFLAGQSAGKRAKAEGASKALCMIQEAYNTALVDRCEGYGEAVPMQMTDTTSDPATIQTRATAALQANKGVDASPFSRTTRM